MSENSSDIVIIGGGLAGSLAALAMAEAGFSVILADQAPLQTQLAPDFDGRTTAIAFASQRLLAKLGVWEPLADKAGPIDDILVTDGRPKDRFRAGGPADGFLHFDSRLLAESDKSSALGFIVENRHLRHTMQQAIAANKAITTFAPVTWTKRDVNAGVTQIHFDDGTRVQASLVISAEGRNSQLRADAGINTMQWSYDQTGIVCTIKAERPHHNIAQEYFLPGGPFAILPLPDNRASLVWTESTTTAQALLALPPQLFLEALGDRFGDYLGTLSLEGPIWSYPLKFHLAEKMFADRLALIGDAAHGIHPIAGQGFNLGIKDIAALRDVLRDAALTGLDIGHGAVLERYQQWRSFDTATLAFGTDMLNRLFSNDSEVLRSLRSAGLGMINRLNPARKFFMRHAGGETGTLPSLMQ